jgi:hypothetical protein
MIWSGENTAFPLNSVYPQIRLYNLYSSADIIRMTKARRMKWVGHATCMWEMRNAYKILVGKP